MEDKGTVEGKQDLVENQSSASATDASSGKRPYEDLVENPSSPSAPAASGTKTEAEGSKRPCVETKMPNHTVMDEIEEEEEDEEVDFGDYDWEQDGGYYLRIEKDRVVFAGERRKPVIGSLGRPPPNALTVKRLNRIVGGTGIRYIQDDDPYYVPWNVFPVPIPLEGLSFPGSGRKVQAEGKRPCDDLFENKSSALATDHASVKGKCPYEDLVENPISATAPSASGTKTEVEGSKRPCVETRRPNHTVMDETEEEEEEEEEVDFGDYDWEQDGGYYLRIEKDRVVFAGERPKPVIGSLGRPPPYALTEKRLTCITGGTGIHYIQDDDPYFNVPWNVFPVPIPPEGLSFPGSDTEA